MTKWTEVNLPWRYFDKDANKRAGERAKKFYDWTVALRAKHNIGPLIDDLARFNAWLKDRPETKEWEQQEEDYKIFVNSQQFCSHPANKSGTVIEVRDQNGETGTLLIGDVLVDGGTGGDYGLETEDVILRYLDLSEVIKEYQVT